MQTSIRGDFYSKPQSQLRLPNPLTYLGTHTKRYQWLMAWPPTNGHLRRSPLPEWLRSGGRRQLTVSEYRQALSRCVVLQEFWGASANNVILECISAHAPVITNRHPDVVEYLGRDYPLYFDSYHDVPRQLEHVEDAHRYLATMDKSGLDVQRFGNDLMAAVGDIKPW